MPLNPDAARGPLAQVVGDALQSLGAAPSVTTRAATALGPRASAPPDVVESEAVLPEDPAGDAVRAHLAKHIRRFLVQDVRVRRDLPDSVHQMRVAARRIRSGLRGFGPLVDAEWSKHLRDELGWIAGELGAVRDTEVMIERLDERAADLPPDESDLAQTAVDRALSVRISDARAHAGLCAVSDIIDCWWLWSRPQPTQTHGVGAALLHRGPASARRQDVAPAGQRCGSAPPRQSGPSVARDADRRRSYSAEAVEPVFGRPAKELVKALEQVTEILGDHQDAHVAQMTLKSLAAEPGMDAPTGFALGLLYALEVDYEMGLRRDFQRLWPKIVKSRTDNPLT